MKRDLSLVKHSGVIHMANEMTLAQRKAFDVMLAHARPELESSQTHVIRMNTLAKAAGIYQNDLENLRDQIRDMRNREFRFNIFGKDRDNAQLWQEYTGLFSSVGFTVDLRLCRYSFPYPLLQLYLHPNLYANLDINSIARLTSRHAVALYEYYLDQLGGRRKTCRITFTYDQMRALLALGNSYGSNKQLNQRVVKPSHEQINERTNIDVATVGLIKEGKGVVGQQIEISRSHRQSGPVTVDQSEMAPDRSSLENSQWEADDTLPTADQGALDLKANLLQVIEDERQVQKIFKNYPQAQIERNLVYLHRKKANGKVRNPGGYLYKAIENDWAASAPLQTQPPEREDTQDFAGQNGNRNPARQGTPEQARAIYDSLPSKAQEKLAANFHREVGRLYDMMSQSYPPDVVERTKADDFNKWLQTQRIDLFATSNDEEGSGQAN